MKQTSQTSKTYTYTTKPFAGTIVEKNGVKGFVFNSKTYYQHEINKFKDGEKVTLEITSKRPKRTEQQNRYLWGVYYALISEETGEQDIEGLHTYFKGMFLTKEIKEVRGQKVRITESTTNLSVGQFCNYVLKIQAETGIEAPPTENYGLAPLTGTQIEYPEGSTNTAF